MLCLAVSNFLFSFEFNHNVNEYDRLLDNSRENFPPKCLATGKVELTWYNLWIVQVPSYFLLAIYVTMLTIKLSHVFGFLLAPESSLHMRQTQN